jgi:transcriptional regulator with XRE-family HTH domain
MILRYTLADCYSISVNYKRRPYPNMLKVIRQNAGYSQQHVAKLLGQNNAVKLCNWENEKTMPNGTSLMKLCILYSKTPEELYPQYYQRIEQYFITI